MGEEANGKASLPKASSGGQKSSDRLGNENAVSSGSWGSPARVGRPKTFGND